MTRPSSENPTEELSTSLSTPNNNESTTQKTFTCFPNLPKELQINIWRQAIDSIELRVLRLVFHLNSQCSPDDDDFQISTKETPHFFLSFNTLSRHTMFTTYSTIIQPGLARIIRFNLKDTIFIATKYTDPEPLPEALRLLNFTTHEYENATLPGIKQLDSVLGPRCVNSEIATMLSGIKRLALPAKWMRTFSEDDSMAKFLFLSHFQGLETLIFVNLTTGGPSLQQIMNTDTYLSLKEFKQYRLRYIVNVEQRARTIRLMRTWRARVLRTSRAWNVDGYHSDSIPRKTLEIVVLESGPAHLWSSPAPGTRGFDLPFFFPTDL